MPDDITKDTQETSEDEGKNTDVAEGEASNTGTSETDESQVDKSKEVKTFTQSQIDDIVKGAKKDAKASAKKEFDSSLEGKKVFTEEELTTYVKTAVDAAIADKQLENVKLSIQSEYGLSDVQIARLQGDTEKALKEDAELIYGKPKKKAPILNTGTSGDKPESKDPIEDEISAGLQSALNRTKARK